MNFTYPRFGSSNMCIYPVPPWPHTAAPTTTTPAEKTVTVIATAAQRGNNITPKTIKKAASYYFQINHCKR